VAGEFVAGAAAEHGGLIQLCEHRGLTQLLFQDSRAEAQSRIWVGRLALGSGFSAAHIDKLRD